MTTVHGSRKPNQVDFWVLLGFSFIGFSYFLFGQAVLGRLCCTGQNNSALNNTTPIVILSLSSPTSEPSAAQNTSHTVEIKPPAVSENTLPPVSEAQPAASVSCTQQTADTSHVSTAFFAHPVVDSYRVAKNLPLRKIVTNKVFLVCHLNICVKQLLTV